MSTSPAPTQSPSPSQSFHYPGCLNLSIVPHNCLGSSNVFQTLFSFFTMVESSPHIVPLQDIPLWRNCPPAFRNYKCFFPPATDSYKPRVATYVHERLLGVISVLPLFSSAKKLPCTLVHHVFPVPRTFQALITLTPVLGASARARFVLALPFSVRTHWVHPGAVCLATIPPAQNRSPLQRWKHLLACHLPQKPFHREFSPPRRAQFLPMILPSL